MFSLSSLRKVEYDIELRHHTLIANADSQNKALVDTLHGHLDVIDNKTSVLLTFNALLVTILAILIGTNNIEDSVPFFDYLRIPVIFSSIGVMISTVMCLKSLDIIGAHSKSDKSIQSYIRDTTKVVSTRTQKYLIALFLTEVCCFVGLIIFVLGLIYSL